MRYRGNRQAASLRPKWWRATSGGGAGLLPVLLLLVGCATPIQVERVDPRAVQRQLTSNVISTGAISPDSEIVLQQRGLWQTYQADPRVAIALLHRAVAAGQATPDVLFALAEMSFRLAEKSGKQPDYLAATVYAFAYLFPGNPAERPNEFDPRIRTASNIYNRSLTSAFASADRSRVALHAGTFALPFGSIDIAFDPTEARWGNFVLSDFTPADELRVIGLRSDYREHGLGAALVADATSPAGRSGFPLAPHVKVPITALLRIDLSPTALAHGHLRGRIDIYPAFDPSVVTVRGVSVPLQAGPTAAFAYGLSDPGIWRSEYAGFLNGSLLSRAPSQLVGLEPYKPGLFPVVFIHGTASSAGRWANMINDLQADPVIRDHFQFWLFSYNTGNPVPFSALQLRTALEAAVRQLDLQGTDPALQDMVLIGHSQGGLLAKMVVIDSGSRLWDAFSSKPLGQMRVSPQTRELLREALFVKPVPEVRRVIFIATPQHGSFVAGSWIAHLVARLVTLPIRVTSALADAVEGNSNAVRLTPGSAGFGSVWSMTPDNPALQAFAAIPIAPGVAAHSIIAVQGSGPIETGNDGVVTYKSAHIAGVQSELVVRSGHSVQDNPQAIAEVRRILLLHLAEAHPQRRPQVAATDAASHACAPSRPQQGVLVVSRKGERGR